MSWNVLVIEKHSWKHFMNTNLASSSPLPAIKVQGNLFWREMKELTAVSPFAASLTLLQLNRLVSNGRSPGYRKDKLFFLPLPSNTDTNWTNQLLSATMASFKSSHAGLSMSWFLQVSKIHQALSRNACSPVHDCLRNILGTVAVLGAVTSS